MTNDDGFWVLRRALAADEFPRVERNGDEGGGLPSERHVRAKEPG